MSSYLLAFVITQLTYTEYNDTVPLRLYSFNCSSANDTKLLKFASDAINFYSNYTGMDYTLPKIGTRLHSPPHSLLKPFSCRPSGVRAQANRGDRKLGTDYFRQRSFVFQRRHLRRRPKIQRPRPRAGSLLVRKPGDQRLVERHLVARRFRHVHGDESRTTHFVAF
jgi:hypothetical protein